MVSTAKVLADKALQLRAGQQCVEWASTMLERGHSGEYLQMLAAFSGDLNHFEVSEYRDRALEELGIVQCTRDTAVCDYAAEILKEYLSGHLPMRDALATVHELCAAADMLNDLYDFYLLFWALDDLLEMGVQHYWGDADLSNIESIFQSRIIHFLSRRGAA